MLLIFIVILAAILRFLYLDNLPAEMWGDVIEHYKLAQAILSGQHFFNFRFGGDGPLFSYFVVFVSKLMGLSFYTMKASSAILGILLIPAVYLFTFELLKNKRTALISSFLAAVSFWSLSFSRQAKPHILVPLFVALVLYFALRKKFWLSSGILAIGMFSQASFWGMALAFFHNLKILIVPLAAGLWIFQGATAEFTSKGFFGEKLGSDIRILFINIFKNIVSFNIRGDGAFRHTIPNQPHLDPISGVFFIIGLIFLLRITLKNKNLLKYFFIPFLAIQIPSLLDFKNPASSPNMGRMIGLLPLVCAATAQGIDKLTQTIKNKIARNILAVAILTTIAVINIYRYFAIYPQFLPNRNTSFGKIIAREIDRLPNDVKVVVVGCCWGDWGQPEPDGIRFQLLNPRPIYFFEADGNKQKFNCRNLKANIKAKKVKLVIDPRNKKAIVEAKKCARSFTTLSF